MRRALFAGAAVCVTLGAGIGFAATAGAATTTYEAEAATLAGGARVAGCAACSGGQKVGYVGADSGTLTFANVVADVAGPATLSIQYVSGSPRSAELQVNDDPGMLITFPATPDWRTPATLEVAVSLVAGVNAVTFGNSGGWAPDFDRLVVSTADAGSPTPTDSAPAPSASVTESPSAPATPSPSASATSSPSTPVTPAPSVSITESPSAPASPSPSGSVPAAPPLSPTPGPVPTGNAALEARVVELVNVRRASAGCEPLVLEPRLTAAARGHSADMAARGYFAHTTPEGVEFSTRITRAGYTWSAAAENIAMGYRDAATVVNGWIGSPGHLRNIEDCRYRETGVGLVHNASNTAYWTQVFASPR